MHNVTGDNAGLQWIWFTIIDEVLSSMAKADMILSGMDNGHNAGVEDQPPSQQEEVTQEVPEEEPKSPRTRASTLLGFRRQPVKKKKLASDMAASLDRFCVSIHRIEELKLEAAIKLHEDNKKLELKIFKLTQTSQGMMENLFVNVLKGLK